MLNTKVNVRVISPQASSVLKPVLFSIYERDKLSGSRVYPEFKVLTSKSPQCWATPVFWNLNILLFSKQCVILHCSRNHTGLRMVFPYGFYFSLWPLMWWDIKGQFMTSSVIVVRKTTIKIFEQYGVLPVYICVTFFVNLQRH